MRATWLLCVAAGCYQPAAEAPCTIACVDTCPAHLVCRDGLCVAQHGPACGSAGDGGIIDARELDALDGPDASTTPCTMPTTAGSEGAITAGDWFVARLASGRYAIKQVGGGAGDTVKILGTSDAIDLMPTYNVVLEDQPSVRLRHPRLAPDGLEMFLQVDKDNAGIAIGRSLRTPGTDTWSTPSSLTLSNTTALSSEDAPSPPTTTSPRFMVISRPSVYVEVREVSATEWTGVRMFSGGFTTPSNAIIQFLGEAHLSEDGLRMIFRGRFNTETQSRAFYVERPTLDVHFPNPARVLPTGGDVSTPYFTSDCRFLFYTRQSDGQVVRVAYP